MFEFEHKQLQQQHRKIILFWCCHKTMDPLLTKELLHAPEASWGTSTELLMVALMYNVQIITIQNYCTGVNHADHEEILRMYNLK